MNVVSTSPSGTEICYALGVEPVAVSDACDYPPAARDKPRIDASRIEGGDSAERHDQVAAAGAHGGVHDVHAERLRAAEPDLIVTQEVCGVCAVDEALVDRVLAELDVDPAILGLDASRIADVFGCIREVGAATGRAERAEELIADLRGRVDAVADRATGIGVSPRVAVVEWMDPPRLAGNWVPDLADAAGADYPLAPGERSAPADWADVVAYDPEVVVVAPCSYPVERTRERIGELAGREGWDGLAAVREGRVYAMDGSAYFNRWTPRLVDALERLAAVVHPDEFGDPPADVARLATA